jgi:SPFH domain / Band 7 family
MFGLRFVKVAPTTYLMFFRSGRVERQGAGLSGFYYAPTTTLVAVPVGSQEQGFIFEHATADFQHVTVQGQVTFRVAEPERTAGLLNFALDRRGRGYASDDPQKLASRVVKLLEVAVHDAVLRLRLVDALRAAADVARTVDAGLKAHPEIVALGLEIQSVAILAIKPTPETARALEAEAREAILRSADDAVYARRNSAVEQERAIRESELETEIAVEQKKRTIREVQMDAEASVQRKKHELRATAMEADIGLETQRKDFVVLNADNTRTLAEAEAHRMRAVMAALQSVDPRVVQAIAATGMQPAQLIALAFGGIADKAERIGQLNVSPELLQSLAAAVKEPVSVVKR